MSTQTDVDITRREAAIINSMFASLADLQRTNRAYFQQLEDLDLETCRRGQIVRLLDKAPNQLVRGFLLGKLSMRISIQNLTGRAF